MLNRNPFKLRKIKSDSELAKLITSDKVIKSFAVNEKDRDPLKMRLAHMMYEGVFGFFAFERQSDYPYSKNGTYICRIGDEFWLGRNECYHDGDIDVKFEKISLEQKTVPVVFMRDNPIYVEGV